MATPHSFTVESLLEELEAMGDPQTKKTWLRHGAKEPCYGVKIGNMKPLQKVIKKDYELSLGLYETGVADAMYFAGLIADELQMSKKDFQKWVNAATWSMIGECTVPWVASESPYGFELGSKWIESSKPHIQGAGWSTLASLVGVKPDAQLPLAELEKLMERAVEAIPISPNRVKYTMNSFIISVGCYVVPLHTQGLEAAKQIGQVQVDMGDTACKVPLAEESIAKVESMGRIGKKRTTARC